MIDLHAHILPVLDDGAQDLNDALEMAALAVESGVTVLTATPHCAAFGPQAVCRAETVRQAVRSLRAALAQAKIPLQLAHGMEIYGTPEVTDLLKNGQLLCLNSSRCPLVEFAFTDCAAQATETLQALRSAGLRPLVAHPERYLYTQDDPTLLNLWVEMGCLLQVNKGSLLGRFGKGAEALAWALVDRGFAFAVASDAHTPVMRTPWMRDAALLLEEEFSPAAARLLLEENPRRLLNNEPIRPVEPVWFR